MGFASVEDCASCSGCAEEDAENVNPADDFGHLHLASEIESPFGEGVGIGNPFGEVGGALVGIGSPFGEVVEIGNFRDQLATCLRPGEGEVIGIPFHELALIPGEVAVI